MSRRDTQSVAIIGGAARKLPEYRREALEVCLSLGVIPATLAPAAPEDSEAVEAALGLLDGADVYVGIIADGCGPVCEPEYEHALARGIPRLMFEVGPRLAKTAAEPGAAAAELESFIRRVGARQPVRRAASPKEFRALLLDGLTGLGIRGATRTRRGKPPQLKGSAEGSAKDAEEKGEAGGKSKPTFRVFVASPRDVRDERSRMPKVVESLNRTLGKLIGVRVELWRWEADAPAAAGETQPLIDVELDEADVVVVIFWNHFGTPTSAGVTGTEGEVLRALGRWGTARRPQVMIYFCQRPMLLDRDGLEQRLRLLSFRERIEPLALAVEYGEVEEFEWRVRDDLFTTIARLCLQRP